MLLSRDQKELILTVLKKENKRMLSGHKGPLLKKTIADLEQALRNEAINDKR
ncbi:hypothetical protein NBRC13296_10170 [Paenibacillus chitinolyticus]|uniref:hypothetical protein n=1 Tax=Paenibacillus chitinolyticus TaxID=79263 RepID=UPI003555F429